MAEFIISESNLQGIARITYHSFLKWQLCEFCTCYNKSLGTCW